jgi:hypothetical protein
MEVPEVIPDGERNDTLFREACRLREFGHTEDEIRATVAAMNDARCVPPLDEGELEKIVQSSLKYPMGSLPEAKPLPAIIKASEVLYEPPRWLIAPLMQKGKGNLIQADNGAGKTAYVCSIAAHVSTGAPILNLPVQSPGNVLILSVEDDLPILRGRIEACGGNLDKCHFMTSAAGLTFNSPEIENAVRALGAKLLIFDPFQAFLGRGVDMHRANETRPELAKLFEMADRNDCAATILAHMSKNSIGGSAVNRALGSVDIPAAMRSIIQIVPNPDNPAERVAVHVKSSNAPKGPSIVFSIGDRGGVTWKGFSPLSADDIAVLAKRQEKKVPYDSEPLVKLFEQLIAERPAGGFWSYAEVQTKGTDVLGFEPFSTSSEFKAMLNSGLAQELRLMSKILVSHGHKANGARGIKLHRIA